MENIKEQLTDLRVKSEVQSTLFAEHKAQNEKDFKHIDDCIHRSEKESKDRDDAVMVIVKEIRQQFEEVKKMVWKATGALLIVVPVLNMIINKMLQ